jgi:hypothetical protein
MVRMSRNTAVDREHPYSFDRVTGKIELVLLRRYRSCRVLPESQYIHILDAVEVIIRAD